MFPRLYKAVSPAIAPRIYPLSITVNRQHRPALGSLLSNQASSSTGPSIAQIRTMASQEIIDVRGLRSGICRTLTVNLALGLES